MSLWGAGGQEAKKLTLLDIGGNGIKQCPETVPFKEVRPRATVRQCSVFLLSEGDRPTTVVFVGTGTGARMDTWYATSAAE